MTHTQRDAVLISATALNTLLTGQQTVSILAVRSDDTSCPRPYKIAPRIPGAIDTNMAEDFAAPSHPLNGSRPLPEHTQLEQTIRRLGLKRDNPIVVYDHDSNLQAARVWWVLRWAGFKNVRMLDGGFKAWSDIALPISHMPPPIPTPSEESIHIGQMPVMDADAAAQLARNGILLDSRIQTNYIGGVTPAGLPRRGHIPGAHSLPAPDNLAENGQFLDQETLRALYISRGVKNAYPVGVYCGAGVSAAHNVAALMMLGITAPMYPGSWSAWISDPARPVATGDMPG